MPQIRLWQRNRKLYNSTFLSLLQGFIIIFRTISYLQAKDIHLKLRGYRRLKIYRAPLAIPLQTCYPFVLAN